jgi:P4 family phage/plasmid primase-like protien
MTSSIDSRNLRITTIEHAKLTGWPRAEGPSGNADAMGLFQALTSEWGTDRHFQAIEPYDAGGSPRRVNVAQLTDEQLRARPVRMVLRVLDVDTPGHGVRDEAWTAELHRLIAALPGAKPLYYLTRGGARLLWELPEPFVIDSRARYKAWVDDQECAVRQMREAYGIAADPACKDPSRLYRLPNVVRAEHGQQRSELYGQLGTWDYKLLAKYREPTALERLDNEAAVCDRPAREMRLARALEANGGLRELGTVKVAVRCPWVETHSDHGHRDPLSGGTIVFATADGEGMFYCSHAHCAKRRQSDVFQALGLEAPWQSDLERAVPDWLRHNPHDSSRPWYVYRDGVWCAVAAAEIYADLAQRCPALLGAATPGKQVAARRALLGQHEQHTMIESDLDPDPYVLCAPNGLIDLRTGELRPHDPGALCSQRTGYAYDTTMPPTAAAQLVLEWCGGDRAVAEHLRMLVGYTMTGLASERLLTWLHGPPGTAKSSFVDLLAAVLGSYAAQGVPSATWLDVPRKPADSIRQTRGRRLVTSSELKGKAWDEDAILPFCGGEDAIRAEGKYKAQIQWKQQCKLWVTSNTEPSGASAALQDRAHVIPFERRYEADPVFKRELPDRYGPPFLVWGVRAAVDYLAAGRLPARPEAVQTATLAATQDDFGGWLAALAKVGAEVKASTLFQAWTSAHQSQAPTTMQAFGKRMRDYSRVYQKAERKDGNYYLGLAL